MKIQTNHEYAGHTGCWLLSKLRMSEEGPTLPDAWWDDDLESWEHHE